MLGVSIGLRRLDTRLRAVHETAAVLTDGSRVTGMAAGFSLLTQILLMSRISVLERSIGSHDLLAWHREIDAAAVILVIAHVVLITLNYAAEAGISVFDQPDGAGGEPPSPLGGRHSQAE